MKELLYITLFSFWAIFGSFASVLIYRFKSGEGGILTGRSHCGKCNRILTAIDLFPIFSWAILGGKCRTCKAKVSPIYPLLEIVMGLVFVISGAYFVDTNMLLQADIQAIIRLLFWLFIGFVSVIVVFYDIAYMEIPDGFLLSSIAILAGLTLYSPHSEIFSHYIPLSGKTTFENALIGAVGIYSFFYFLFCIPFVGYYCKKRKWKELGILFGYYLYLIPESIYLSITKKQVNEEADDEEAPGAWIGLGDLRIAIFMGFVGWAKIAGLGLFLSYVVGSIISIIILITSKNRWERHEVPFWPFLIIGLYLSLLCYEPIVNLIFPSL